MAIKKSELYSSLWASCDALRGGMDASQYKDYVPTLLFVKYVSDKYAGNPMSLIEIPKGSLVATNKVFKSAYTGSMPIHSTWVTKIYSNDVLKKSNRNEF